MIRIKRDDLPQIAEVFSEHLTEYLRDKRYKHRTVCRLDQWITANDGTGYGAMLNFFKQHYDDILTCDSKKDMLSIIKDFYSLFKNDIKEWRNASKNDRKETQFGRFKEKMFTIYDEVMAFEINDEAGNTIPVGYWLSRKLNVMTCPYCNRHYTFTVVKTEDGVGLRPQFDHFYPKSRFPILAVCPYNLVPACADCNKTKEDHLLKIHPYEDSFSANDISFYIKPRYVTKNPVVGINKEKHSNVRRLALTKLYEGHDDLVSELSSKAVAYNSNYYQGLMKSFSGLGLTESDIQRIVWGTSLDESEELQRPFSKLTRDILIQFGII